jgi:Uma2 family endonuclease
MTTAAGPELEQVTETYVKWVPDRPMTFEEFLDRFGEDDDVELVDGVPVEKMAAQLDHERLFIWLVRLLGDYVEARNLGEVLGSRSAVQINNFRGRLPDLLFVRRDRDDFEDIVRQRAIYGAPDLVVEFVSPGDRPSDVVALETDYRAIGVAEIWFVDQRQQRVRVLRRQTDGAYAEAAQGAGPLASSVVAGFEIDVAWLWANPRPAVRDVIAGLLAGESGSESR